MDTHAHDSPPSLLEEIRALRAAYDLDTPAKQQPLWLWLFTVLVARLLTVMAAATAALHRDPMLSIAEHHHAMAMGGNPRALALALGAASDRAASAEAENRALRAALDPSPTPAFFPDNTTFAEEAEEAERKRLETQAPPAPAPGPEPVAEPAAEPQAPAGRKVGKGRMVTRGG